VEPVSLNPPLLLRLPLLSLTSAPPYARVNFVLMGGSWPGLLFPPLLSSVPFLSFLPTFRPPLPLEVGPLNPARESGGAL